ncbi:hypothetical protein SAMN04488102_11710 [Alkalibacterium subtropicum]|uniref:DUF3953 domain-containing protein n=1 Tax=Alkalibacterium subtropicum TaxID=753702 RepID=A0A1I1L112_9LACT|nr:hypothetical protein SAMN04488102_11710 [Alkalibacterium subtropicum]
MLKALQKIALVISIIIAVYGLISRNYSLFPLIIVFQLVSLFVMALHDLKEGRKTKGVLSFILVITLSIIFIYTLMNYGTI